jgi:CobQ-like glutamine amidotransferase family enzyme
VSRVLKFAALYPEHLNLNGDHANLLVLQKRLKWRGVVAEIIPIMKPSSLSEFDFILLGHGSVAAWDEVQSIDPELLPNIVKLLNSNRPLLAVGSGYIKVMEVLASDSVTTGDHVSEFRNFEGVVGYLNSDSELPEVTWIGNSMLTLFHGPVLAKNPAVADEIISKSNWCDTTLSSSQLMTVDEFAEASRHIAFED